jgi:hypothetical protein
MTGSVRNALVASDQRYVEYLGEGNMGGVIGRQCLK